MLHIGASVKALCIRGSHKNILIILIIHSMSFKDVKEIGVDNFKALINMKDSERQRCCLQTDEQKQMNSLK
jgi:hypothetical protein